MMSQNRKRSKNVPYERDEQAVVFPRNVWFGLSSFQKKHVVAANTAYMTNDSVLNSRGASHRSQSRMSLPIIAKMSVAMPGSNSEGGIPVLLRDLADATMALAQHTQRVRAYVGLHAERLTLLQQYVAPADEENISEAASADKEDRLLVKGLLDLLCEYPSTLMYDHDESPFVVSEAAHMDA